MIAGIKSLALWNSRYNCVKMMREALVSVVLDFDARFLDDFGVGDGFIAKRVKARALQYWKGLDHGINGDSLSQSTRELTERRETLVGFSKNRRMAKIRLCVRDIRVERHFHLDSVEDAGVGILHITSELVLVPGEELWVADDGEMEDLSENSSNSVVSGQQSERRSLRTA